MRTMNPRHRSELYNHDDREAAAVLLAECAGKTVRKMGPLDYSAANIPVAVREPVGIYGERACRLPAIRKRKSLASACCDLLRKNGAMTTAQLARELKKSSRAIACALVEVPGILRETQVAKYVGQGVHRSRETLWMVPVRAKEPQYQ